MFDGEPIVAAIWPQIIIQFLVDQSMLGIAINFPGLSEGTTGISALLGNPEWVFKTNKDGYPYNSKELWI